MEGKYANICVDISHEKVDRPFQYKVPRQLRGKLKPGMQVQIPFGKGNNPKTGDTRDLTGHMIVLALSSTGLVILRLTGKRKKEEE